MTMADETPTTPSAPALPAHPDFAKPPAAQGEQREAPAPAPAAPTSVQLTMEQVQHYMGLERRLQQIEADKQAEIEAKQREANLALAKSGEAEQALENEKKSWQAKQLESERRYKALEAQVFDERADAVLSGALNGQVFAGQDDAARASAARMLKTILRGEIEAVRDAAGQIVVRDKASGRPAADVLSERLSDPTLAFFFAPKSRGGSGGDGTRTPANQQQPSPGSLDANVAEFKARQGQYRTMGLGPSAS